MTVEGTAWEVDEIVKITDGDTIRVERSRVTQLGDDWYRIIDTNPDGTPRSIPIRLVWVDTPERGEHPGWERARADLITWISVRSAHTDGNDFRVICYESAGWDRLLGDLIDANGDSASQWLMTERGWPPYTRGK